MTTPLEDYAMIGDGETVALVSRHGSIDWLCLPRFDSPACCAALLGNTGNGRWSIASASPYAASRQRYEDDSLILVTEFDCEKGCLRLTDLMPVRNENPLVLRIVECTEGEVDVRNEADFRFDYGNMPPWITLDDGRITFHVGPDAVVLDGFEDFERPDTLVVEQFRLKEGEKRVFAATYDGRDAKGLSGVDPERLLAETRDAWHGWIGKCRASTRNDAMLRRSLITLKALIHRPTGGLVAAPTTSLPEQPGGSMNWDYRYCWLRDATFTLEALAECGFVDEARDWRDWILRAVAAAPDKLQIMYRVDGSRRLDEAELPWLSGYRFARPVRIGNAAAGQFQLDVYGEVIQMLHASEKAGMDRTEQGRQLEHALVRHIVDVWRQPDAGLWESRGKPRHYTYSKVMAWVGIDRFLGGKGGREIDAPARRRLEATREEIRAVILEEAYNPGLRAFTSYFGGDELDAALLLLPKLGFLPAEDERMAETIVLIEERLAGDGLVRRHRMDTLVPEGAFIACSFWLADVQIRQGRHEAASRTIDQALARASSTGLMSEEYDVTSQRLTGNFPQALSHLALVQALLAEARMGENPQKGAAQ
ncbi:glycoside hydrolase family 15 protein [Jiella sonneratiae]|uniref:Glycoside hydrolase family 15 protein n=1 Tax=Jiella sonneratiae TaxID=2816856 RepID=A0ABS3IZ94_9HYPH|nr:glycoside hydrolase family 15 protein [Jiella sonneratiae]MBO0902230.1 glycoside hydrolase family 15 protein [Jiella sonneratiae]